MQPSLRTKPGDHVSYADEFGLPDELMFLNHAAVAPWPRRAGQAVEAFAQANVTRGPLAYEEWERTEQRLRERLARLVGPTIQAGDIALLKNTSEALSVVAAGLAWEPGDNVVVARQEFPSNRMVWQALAARGVETRLADLHAAYPPEQALLDQVDGRTRLISVSAVQYGDGLRMDLASLGQLCRERDIRFCVDAIQALGAVRFDAEACGADFVMADGHKWMLGPEGVAVFWCRPEQRERLALTQFGWHMSEAPRDFDRLEWTPAADARRFEAGSPNMLGIHALEASLGLLEEVGMARVEELVLHRGGRLIEQLAALPGIELLTPRERSRRAGIVTFRHARHDPARLHRRLRAAGVVCAHRGGGVRLSPHFYTPERTLDQAVTLVADYTGE